MRRRHGSSYWRPPGHTVSCDRVERKFKDHIQELTSLLDAGHRVVFKVKAHDGYDLHLFSRDKIYRWIFFMRFQPLIPGNDLRFFQHQW